VEGVVSLEDEACEKEAAFPNFPGSPTSEGGGSFGPSRKVEARKSAAHPYGKRQGSREGPEKVNSQRKSKSTAIGERPMSKTIR